MLFTTAFAQKFSIARIPPPDGKQARALLAVRCEPIRIEF
jgi:hypothetical protein